MKVLVTGASGFIGSNLMNRLGMIHQVEGTFQETYPKDKNWTKLWFCDMTERCDIGKILSLGNYDVVIHCAAKTSGSKDILDNPAMHVAENILMNTILIRECAENKVPLFIGLSCSVVYPPTGEIHKEDEKLGELFPAYFGGGHMKIAMERLAEFYSIISDTKFVILRHTNIYGEHDKYDRADSHVFASFISQVEKKNWIDIRGTGEEQRDFLYVGDFVSFIVNIIDNPPQNKFDVFNVGLGETCSVKDLAKMVAGDRVTFHHSEKSIPVDIRLDISKAKDRGWIPTVYLKKGISICREWYRNHCHVNQV